MRRIRSRFSSTARAGYALAGAALLVLPTMVVYREGSAGVTTGLALSVLFGIGYLIAAAVGGRISDDLGGTA
jgi:hypothetical protein